MNRHMRSKSQPLSVHLAIVGSSSRENGLEFLWESLTCLQPLSQWISQFKQLVVTTSVAVRTESTSSAAAFKDSGLKSPSAVTDSSGWMRQGSPQISRLLDNETSWTRSGLSPLENHPALIKIQVKITRENCPYSLREKTSTAAITNYRVK